MSLSRFAPIALAVLFAGGCQQEKLGQPCGTASEPTPVPDTDDTTPVEGEEPVVEVVRVETDSACESFKCITHGGLSPYCSRRCTLEPPKAKQGSCTADSACTGAPFASGGQGHCVDGRCVCQQDNECSAALHCVDGRCTDDDCPSGFWCKHVNEVGPRSEELYCVFKDGCTGNQDCGALGSVECRNLGCYDACLADDCTFHQLTCEPLDEQRCQCCSGATSVADCPDAELACNNGECGSTWEGAVHRRSVCMPKEFYP